MPFMASLLFYGPNINYMKFDASTEWRNFKHALIQELKATPLTEFESFWPSRPDRTRFYKTKLLPNVAARMGHHFRPEFLLVDYAILNDDHVPVVFIESEHSHPSASHEIEKLCAVCSPVKVLLLCCEWADGVREECLPSWKKRITTHHKYYDLNAVYILVVGEWGRGKPKDDEILRYYIESFDIFGMEIEPKEILELSKP